MQTGVHINLDDAWDPARVNMRSVDARPLGPFLRYTAPQRLLEQTFGVLREGVKGDTFVLYGSGDYHYLAAWWISSVVERANAHGVLLVSFDNHPDWDVRPPRWACGGWINRALEMERIAAASVWGCGNFEFAFPSRLFRNRRALAAGKLTVHPWAERQSPAVAQRFNAMTRENWRDRFAEFARASAGKPVYVTLDLDALVAEAAVTNWENGLFTVEDLVWALGELHRHTRIIGGDCCGAFSEPAYVRRWQRFVAAVDHPKLSPRTLEGARQINHGSLNRLWPALVGAASPTAPDQHP